MDNKKIKVMHITMRFSGGIFTFLQDLTSGLKDEIESVIIYAPNPNTPENFRSLFDKEVRLIRATSYQEDHNPLGDNNTRNELKELFEQEQPDVIHLHGYHAGRLGRKAFESLSIPVFYTPHGYRFYSEDHNRLTRSLFRRTEQSLAKGNCMTVACSKGEFAEALGFSNNATYINNGIDTKKIDSTIKEIPSKDHPFTVFTMGLINPQKNPDLFNEIARAMPEVRFLWIGDGEDKWKLSSPNIEITGWLNHEEAIQKMVEGDVFILTSLWEGLPITLLEAMYLKKLCIVSNVVGNRDVIVNGENGYICDSAAAFVNAISHYRDEETKEIIETAHQDIIENYSLEQMISSYRNLYKENLKQS